MGNENFGIWITISSFLIWAGFIDVGLGHGLRNKLAETLANNDFIKSKKYISTTYFLLFIISFLMFSIFFVLNHFIKWSLILNSERISNRELQLIALIIFGFFFLRFVLKLIGVVLLADQRPAISSLFIPLGDLIGLSIIYFISLSSTHGSLVIVALVYSISPIIVFIFASIYFYIVKYRKIAPSIKYIELKYAKELLSLGASFFAIQLLTLTLFQSTNILVNYYFGPNEVTNYYIAYRYFSILQLLMTILITPFWSAFTHAWTKKEIYWIQNAIRNLQKVWIIFVLFAIILVFGADVFFKIWLGSKRFDSIVVKFELKVVLAIFFLLYTFGGIFNMFLNGISKIKLQMISFTIGVVVYFPLVNLFVKVLNMGSEGIVLALMIANFYMPIIAPIQYKKIINKRAYGIWNK